MRKRFTSAAKDFPKDCQRRWRLGRHSSLRLTAPWWPTVRADATQADQRKGKSVQWQECKVSLAHVHESGELFFGATLLGDVDVAGKQLRACAKRAGFGQGHRVHGGGRRRGVDCPAGAATLW